MTDDAPPRQLIATLYLPLPVDAIMHAIAKEFPRAFYMYGEPGSVCNVFVPLND